MTEMEQVQENEVFHDFLRSVLCVQYFGMWSQ
jgi:hypothetical protein